MLIYLIDRVGGGRDYGGSNEDMTCVIIAWCAAVCEGNVMIVV
jgi:hypothetical protein